MPLSLAAGALPRTRGCSGRTSCGLLGPSVEQLQAPPDDLAHLERTALHLVEADRVDEVLGPQQPYELAEVDLGHEHLSVAAEDLAEVGRQRVQVAEVHVRDRVALLAHLPD